jgi:2Fe-2S ferredoxin
MPDITFVQADGASKTVTVSEGKRVMQSALSNGIDGIIGECGGQAMCATCHVYVEEPWRDQLPSIRDEEEEMLEDTVCERNDASRLSCQIVVTDAIDGITVLLPERQV